MTSDAPTREIEADVTRLLIGFFNDFDEGRVAPMARRFAADGEWIRRGKTWVGPDGITRAVMERSPTLRVRHVVTNILVTPEGREEATFMLYLTAYMHDDGSPASPPIKIERPAMFLVVEGSARATTEGWRIGRMAMNREFDFA